MYYRVTADELHHLFLCHFFLGISATVTGIAGGLGFFHTALAGGAFAVVLLAARAYLTWHIMVGRPADESFGN
jgi:hypothetical protein